MNETWSQRLGLANLSTREKLLGALAIAAVLYAIFKQPDVKVTTIKDEKIVEVERWREKKLTKDFLNIRGLKGSTVKFNPDGSYEIVGPFELTRSTTGETVSEGERARTEERHEKTVTEPAVAWRAGIFGMVDAKVSSLSFPPKVAWEVGGIAHLGQLRLLGLKFDIGGMAKYRQDPATQEHYVGLGPLVTF
jgi:hypothetical protein